MEMEIDPPRPELHQVKDADLFKAAETGDSSTFKALPQDQLLKALSLRNEDGRSLLHVAASSGHSEVVNVLSAADPSRSGINDTDEEGWAPLHSAASIGNAEIVETLLSRGADINLKNGGGRAALHYAASKGWLKIAEILISHGAKINLKDKVGCTPLHRAASTGNSELCELLIEEGAEVDAVDKAGQTPLMNSVICHNKEEIESLVSPTSKELPNMDGYTTYELFSMEHKKLVEEGQKWMKETAISCTAVAALIVTVMFAAALTIPNSGNIDFSIFSKTKSFQAFITSDSISFLSSTTSVMILLGILTSLYGEVQFLKSLPTKIILGLTILFISIASMIITFCSSITLTLYGQMPRIFIPVLIYDCQCAHHHFCFIAVFPPCYVHHLHIWNKHL